MIPFTRKLAARLTIFALVGAMALSACAAQSSVAPMAPPQLQSGSAGQSSLKQPGDTGAVMNDSISKVAVSESQSQDSPDGNVKAASDRVVLKNATLNLVVDDTAGVLKTISAMAEESGGWIVTSNSYQSAGQSGTPLTFGAITIRVAAATLNDTLSKIKALAVTVTSDNVTGEDVTQHYTDLTSQLTNLQAAEDQLRKIMDSAAKTEDVLAVYRELTNVRGQIEVIKGQIQYYDEAASFSSIAVNLTPSEAAKPLTIGGWQPGTTVKNALQTLINSLQGIADVVIWLAIVVVPIALPLLIIFWLFRKTRRRRLVQNATPAASDSPAST